MNTNPEVYSHTSSSGMRFVMTVFTVLIILLILLSLCATGLIGSFKFVDKSPVVAGLMIIMFLLALWFMGLRFPWQRKFSIRSDGMSTISSLYLNGWTSWEVPKDQIVCAFTITAELDHLGVIVRDNAGSITAFELGPMDPSEKVKGTAVEINHALGLPQGEVLHIESELPDLGQPWSAERLLFAFSYSKFRQFIAARRV
jgi:hypothetical protein